MLVQFALGVGGVLPVSPETGWQEICGTHIVEEVDGKPKVVKKVGGIQGVEEVCHTTTMATFESQFRVDSSAALEVLRGKGEVTVLSI